MIREGKTHMLDNIINTSAQLGMISLERGLVQLIQTGLVDFDTAVRYTQKPDELKRLMNLNKR